MADGESETTVVRYVAEVSHEELDAALCEAYWTSTTCIVEQAWDDESTGATLSATLPKERVKSLHFRSAHD